MPTLSGRIGFVISDGWTSYPNFFRSFVTTLKEMVMNPWERTRVTVEENKKNKRIKHYAFPGKTSHSILADPRVNT